MQHINNYLTTHPLKDAGNAHNSKIRSISTGE